MTENNAEDKGQDDVLEMHEAYEKAMAEDVEKDSLAAMVKVQFDAMSHHGLRNMILPANMTCPAMLSDESKREWFQAIQREIEAAQQETAEAKDWLPWKYWSKRSGNKEVEEVDLGSPEHLEEIQMELIDIIKFALNALILTGLTHKGIMRLFMKKTGVSLVRWSDGKY